MISLETRLDLGDGRESRGKPGDRLVVGYNYAYRALSLLPRDMAEF
jgi:hypothetical protein